MIVNFQTHCILLNGPPRSGKDSFADAVCGVDEVAKGHVVVRSSFGQALRQVIRPFTCAVGAPQHPTEWQKWYDENKDRDMHEVLDVPRTIRSLRHCMIELSENFVKENFGQNIYGRLVLRHWLNLVKHTHEKHGNDEGIEDLKFTLVVTDLGFEDEGKVMFDFFRPHELTVVQLHREGCNFDKDSRSYVTLGAGEWAFNNDGMTLDEWHNRSRAVVQGIWENRENEQRRIN